MNAIDIIIIGILVIQACLGFQRGFVRIVFDILGIFCGLYVGYKHYQELGYVLQTHIHIAPHYANLAAFFGIWLAIFIAVFAVSKLINAMVTLTGLGIMNRLGGFVLGGAKGVFLILPILVPLVFMKARIIENSKLVQPLMPYLDSIIDVYFHNPTHAQSNVIDLSKETMTNRT